MKRKIHYLLIFLCACAAVVHAQEFILDVKDGSGRTLFHWAVANGNQDLAKYLLSKGSNINNRNSSQSTPLHAAVSANNIKIAEWLIMHGAEIDAKNSMGWTPLFWAARVGGKDMVLLLLGKGADINTRDKLGYTPLDIALNEGNRESIDILLENGAVVDLSGERGIDVIQTAAEKGLEQVFNLVLEKGGAELFKDQAKNRITMNKAISGGSVEIVNTLVAMGIPLDIKADVYGITPIHLAAENGKVAMLKYLDENGVNINQRTIDGKSAYNIAEEKKFPEFADAVLALGGKPGQQEFPVLKGPYLGQKTPGIQPLRFAPGLVSTASHEFSSCFSPDGQEFYFTRLHPVLNRRIIMFSKLHNGVWTEPAVAPFSGQDAFEPFVTPDNKRLYFQSGRVVAGALQMFTFFVERTDTGWGEVIDPGSPFNPMRTMHISATSDGTIYTTDISGGGAFRTGTGATNQGFECLGIIKMENGKYEKLEKLGPPLDKYSRSQHPWVAPDESCIVYTVNVSGQQGKSVLYYSEKQINGIWGEPKQVPLELNAGQPFITPDGKYLFFTSFENGQGDLFWVSTDIIRGLR